VRDAGADETGVLAIRGPNVFAGYLNPEHEKRVWIERRGETWLNTGDLARQDADGYFWLTGRKKELIIRGGHNIDPKIIEEALADHPAVALAAAVGRPDAHSGEVPVAYVQLHAKARASGTDLIAFAAEKLAERAAWPKAVHIMTALPTTAVGKTFKPALTLMEIESVVREECAAAGVTPLSVACAFASSGKALATIELDQAAQAHGAPTLAERLRQFTFGWEIRAGGEALSG
jgi:fatty-acyl-CoA synthase